MKITNSKKGKIKLENGKWISVPGMTPKLLKSYVGKDTDDIQMGRIKIKTSKGD